MYFYSIYPKSLRDSVKDILIINFKIAAYYIDCKISLSLKIHNNLRDNFLTKGNGMLIVL